MSVIILYPNPDDISPKGSHMQIAKRLRHLKKSFFTINQSELTPFSKLLMMLFFLTALWLIAAGIGSSVRQTTPPQQKYGYQCTYFANASHLKLRDFEKRKYSHDDFGTAPECRKLQKAYRKILDNPHIQSEISQIKNLEKKLNNINFQIQRLDKEYAAMLLEKVAKQPKNRSILHANADNVLKKLSALHTKQGEIKHLLAQKNDVLNYPLLQNFALMLNSSADTIKNNYARAQKFYRLQMSAQVFAFVIPIWLLFYLLYRFLTKRRKYIFAQLSFYVASAAALYGLVELVQLIYSIIPKVFLAKVIAFFTSHNMIIVLNVLGILLFLAIFGIIIHKVQQNYEKNRARKDTKVLNVKRQCCFKCGTQRRDEDTYCAFCGENLKALCPSCQHEIYRYTLFCNHCGQKQEIGA